MPLFSNTEQIRSGCAAHIDGFRKLCEFHSLRSGSPAAFLQLAPKLASSEGFRLDFSDLVRTIRDRERGRLRAADMLTIVGLAIGGPGIVRAEAGLYESAGTVQVLLAGVGGWREAEAGPRGEIGTEGEEEGFEREGSRSEGSGSGSAGVGESGVESHGPGRNGEAGGGGGPMREHGRAELEHGGDGAGPGGGATPKVKDTLARLELASMQMKVYLDDIDRRMERIEPHVEGLTAMVQTERAAGQKKVAEGAEERAMPEAGVPRKRRRSEETIAAAMERSRGGKDGFDAGWGDALADGEEGREFGMREEIRPEVASEPEAVAREMESKPETVSGPETVSEPETASGLETASGPEVVPERDVEEPKVAARELAGGPRVIRYEAARQPREIRDEARTQTEVIPKERAPERKEVRDETSSELTGAGGEVAAESRVMVLPEVWGAKSEREGRARSSDDAQAAPRNDAPAAPRRRQWAWGATAASLLVAASVVALYGPWHMSGSRAAEVAVTPIQSGDGAGRSKEGRGPDAATANQGGSGDGGLSGASGAEIVSGGAAGSGSGDKGRSGSGVTARTLPGAAADGSVRRPDGDRGVTDQATHKPSATAPAGVPAIGTGQAVRDGAGVAAALPATSASSMKPVAGAPTGSTEVPKGQVVGAQAEAPKNRVEGARAEEPSRVARVENLHPEGSAERADGASATPARVETAAMATSGAPAPAPAPVAVAVGPAMTKAPAPPSASMGATGATGATGAAGGGLDVPRTTAGRPEITPVGTGGTVLIAPSPIYPQQARQLGLEGQVVIRAMVNKAGAVTNVQVVNGPVLLQQSAQDAVRRRRYKPFLIRGEPVEFQTMVTLIYRLGR